MVGGPDTLLNPLPSNQPPSHRICINIGDGAEIFKVEVGYNCFSKKGTIIMVLDFTFDGLDSPHFLPSQLTYPTPLSKPTPLVVPRH